MRNRNVDRDTKTNRDLEEERSKPSRMEKDGGGSKRGCQGKWVPRWHGLSDYDWQARCHHEWHNWVATTANREV